MRKRFLIHELAISAGNFFSIEPEDVALEFLIRWLKAEPKIFLNDARRQRYLEYWFGLSEKEKKSTSNYENDKKMLKEGQSHSDLFAISNSQAHSLDGKTHYYNPKEIELDRLSLIGFMDKFNWGHPGLGKKISDAFSEGSFSHEFFIFIADNITKADLSEDQWFEFTRISMTLEMAIRFCTEVYDGIPPEIRMYFGIEYARDKSNGPYANEKAPKRECYDCMMWLVNNGLHKPRNGGKQECVELIQAFWDIDRDLSSIGKNIAGEYKQLWSNVL